MYTQLILTVEVLYISVEYYVHTISNLLYTLYICLYNLKRATFISYSHSQNNMTNKKVGTKTSKSPLSPYFRAISRTTNGLHLIHNCSASKRLKYCNNHMSYVIVIEKMVWIRKLVLTMFSMMKYFIIIIDFRLLFFLRY